jgi:hypothetical protein
VPVALMLGDPTDPLGSQAAVEGLVAMVTALDSVALMRSDLSAIGAVARGALMGSIGTLTSCRNFVQPTKRAGGVPDDKTPSVLVEAIASYVRGSKLEYVEGDRGILTCQCPVCDGRSLTRFGESLSDGEKHCGTDTPRTVVERSSAGFSMARPPHELPSGSLRTDCCSR